MESAPRYGVLGRHTACSTKRIDLPLSKIERSHPLQFIPSLLYLESNCDGNWRNHTRESICVTSTSSKDFLLKIIGCLGSDVARSSKDIQRIELKPNYQVQGDSLQNGVKKPWNVPLSQEKHDNVTDPTSTGRPVCGHESTERCVLTPEHVENDQIGTWRPVTVEQKEMHKIVFRVPGLSHAVVEEAEHFRVQELFLKRSKIILIDEHFKPTCSRITSTIHSTKIRRR